MNILKEALEIVYKRSEEKERQYGDFHDGMEKASKIASTITNKDITTVDMYKCIIALKLSRESHSHKEDNLLDVAAYMSSMNDYINKKQNK